MIDRNRERGEKKKSLAAHTQDSGPCGSRKKALSKRKGPVTAAILIVSLFVMLIAELISNADYFLGAEGSFPLLTEPVYCTADGKGPVVKLDADARGKLVISYDGAIDIKPDGDSQFSLFPVSTKSFKFTFVSEDGEELLKDKQPAVLKNEVVDIAELKRPGEEAAFEIDLSCDTDEGGDADFSGVYFSDIHTENLFEFNPYRAFFVFVLSFQTLLILAYRSELFKRSHLLFLIISLTLGSSLTISLPANKVGYDEETHLQAVMDIASFPTTLHISDSILYQTVVTDFNAPEYQPKGLKERHEFYEYANTYGNYKDGDNNPDFYTMANRVPAYLASALGVKLAKGLSLPWTYLMLFGRMANLFMYAALMCLAVKKIPVGKYLMLAIGLFPQNIFLASTFSYDPFITGMLCLGMAYFTDMLFSGRGEIGTGKFILTAVFILLGCLPKAVYAPLIFLLFLIPKENFRSRREALICRIIVVIVFAALIAAFILPTALAPAETGDTRGGATSEVSQVGYILGHPFAYAAVLIAQMIRWIPQCFFGPDCTTFMGHIVNGEATGEGYYPVVLASAVLAVLTALAPLPGEPVGKESAQRAFTWVQKLVIFLIIGAVSSLIWTSMYVAFTEPGAPEIAGVQGRYFIPLIFPLYILFAPRRLPASLARHRELCYYLIILLSAGSLAASIMNFIITRFCL